MAWLLGACSTDEAAVSGDATAGTAGYVGSETCRACHADEYAAWRTSHHWHAMQTVEAGLVADTAAGFAGGATPTSFARADAGLRVTTDGPDGEPASFPVVYTFGVEPLQQFLVDAGRGRLQALDVAWDSRPADEGGQRWFHLQGDAIPDHNDVMHWTRPSHSWNFMCADCHSTGVRKNYDASDRSYDTAWQELTVGCEACHGPGSAHVAAGAGEMLGLAAQREQINACAPCHSRRSQLAEGFAPDRDFLDHYLPSLLQEGLYHPDGQILDEVYVYGSFLQSKMHQQGVKCSNCHEPHSAELRLDGDDVCTQCHNAGGRADFPTLAKKAYDAPEHHFHAPGSAGARCVSCHMTAETYMVVDPRRDHGFRIPRPELSVALGTPNACSGCHTERSAEWAVDELVARFGAREAHYGKLIAAARAADTAMEQDVANLAMDASQPGIVRATLLGLMAGYQRRMTSVALEAGLRDPDPLVRIGALAGAERWEPERRWRQVKRLLRDERLAVRSEATRVLMPILPALVPADAAVLSRAIDDYLGVLRLNEDRAEGQTNIAAVHLARNDIPAAEAALDESLVLNPQWVPALVNLADLYRASGRDDRGGELLSRAEALVPDNPDVLLARALWLVRRLRSAEAVPLLKRAWELSRHSRFAYVYAIALHDTGKSRDALLVLEQQIGYRADRQLIEAAKSIAGQAGLNEKLAEYLEMWR